MATKNKKKRPKKTKTLPPVDSVISGIEDHEEVDKSLVRIVSEHERSVGDEHQTSVNDINESNGLEQQGERRQKGSVSEGVCLEAKGSDKKSKKKRNKKTVSGVPVRPSTDQSQGSSEQKCYTFEEQVEWCIGQLELGLLRSDATKAQKDSNEKNMKTLRSTKVAIPRKRQLMRSLFGDYRSKMISTPLPKGVRTSAKQPCVSAVEKDVAEDCGKFFRYKQSHFKSLEDTQGVNSHSEEQQLFSFDFIVDS